VKAPKASYESPRTVIERQFYTITLAYELVDRSEVIDPLHLSGKAPGSLANSNSFMISKLQAG
jgi:hypothetical protein